jgi:nitrilase
VFDPSGQCLARYDKIHLFRFENEKESCDQSCVLERGAQPVTFDLPSIDGTTYRIGMSICYDLRFPELYRQLKADILLVPSDRDQARAAAGDLQTRDSVRLGTDIRHPRVS